jgi:HEAT repeat protein
MTNTAHDDNATVQSHVRDVVVAGHAGNRDIVRAALGSDEPQVRAAALGAAVRLTSRSAPTSRDDANDEMSAPAATSSASTAAALLSGLHDIDASVRRRAAVEIGRWGTTQPGPTVRDTEQLAEGLIQRLALPDEAPVCEVVAFACGELHLSGDPEAEAASPERRDLHETVDPSVAARIVAALADQATRHDDHLCRESAVAALGSIGDPDGLPAVLAGCEDRATVRRRAVLALAAFDDPRATAALTLLLTDRDLQVRQAAEELLAIEGGELT